MQVEELSRKLSNWLDLFSSMTGRATSWLTLFMVVVTFVIVVMRYVFDAGMIWLQESVVWMHAIVFMIGAAYTLRYEGHVRVDIFYRDMGVTRKAWVDLVGVLVFLMPLCLFLAFKAWDFAEASWELKEASRESGGMPYPLVPLLKSLVIVMPVAVALQGLSLALHSLRRINSGDGQASSSGGGG